MLKSRLHGLHLHSGRGHHFCSGKLLGHSQVARKPVWIFSSSRSTMSPSAKFHIRVFHFCLCCKEGRYSQSQWRQNTSARYCTCRHLLEYWSFARAAGGNTGPDLSRSRWLGVRASQSIGSSEIFIIGLPLAIASTSHMRVSSLRHQVFAP